MSILPHGQRPDKSELQQLYSSGRLQAVMDRFQIACGTAWRWCHEVGIPMTKRTRSYRDDVFDVIDSEQKAYTLGLIVRALDISVQRFQVRVLAVAFVPRTHEVNDVVDLQETRSTRHPLCLCGNPQRPTALSSRRAGGPRHPRGHQHLRQSKSHASAPDRVRRPRRKHAERPVRVPQGTGLPVLLLERG